MSRATTVTERAHAKVNLVLRVGAPRPDGMHPLCSLFAALDLHDDVTVAVDPGGHGDSVHCPGVHGDNLAAAALAAIRAAAPAVAALPPLRVDIEKRIPIAAGLAGGSADAAAALRGANALAGRPLTADQLRAIAAGLGSDVPSQVEPAHAIVSGVGERVERVALPPLALVLLPRGEGLSAAAAYAETDRLGRFADDLDPRPLRELAARAADPAAAASEPAGDGPATDDPATAAAILAAALANDLQPAVLSLRPELDDGLDLLRQDGALAAQISGSGPTAFGVFADRRAADEAALRIAGRLRGAPIPIVAELLA